MNCTKVNHKHIFDFQQKNKFITFSYDNCCSFHQCLTSPSECLTKLSELELDFSCFTEENVSQLKFNNLTVLTKLIMTRKHSQDQFVNMNSVYIALSQINTLESLYIENIEVDENSVKYLGQIRNLKKLRLTNFRSTLGEELYIALRINLPSLTELSMSTFNIAEEIDRKWICDMITALPNLLHFSHYPMTWQLLNTILQVQLLRKEQTMKVGIPKILFDDPKKVNNSIKSKTLYSMSDNSPYLVTIRRGKILLKINHHEALFCHRELPYDTL